MRPALAVLFLLALPLDVLAQRAPALVPGTSNEILAYVQGSEAEVVVVNFWATWCVPCLQEMPYFAEVGREMADEGVEVLFVSMDFEDQEAAAREALEERGIGGMSFHKRGKDDAFIRAFHDGWTGALPATLVYEGGEMVQFWEGKVDEAELRGRLAALLEQGE